jgi:hypothetical protein
MNPSAYTEMQKAIWSLPAGMQKVIEDFKQKTDAPINLLVQRIETNRHR